MRIAVLLLLTLVACAPQQRVPINRFAPEDSCGAAKVQHHLGITYDARNFEDLSQPLRVVPPGSAVTLDHQSDRLNIDLDAQGNIIRFWCG